MNLIRVFVLVWMCMFAIIGGQAQATSLPKHSDRGFVVDLACKEEKECRIDTVSANLWTERARVLQRDTGVQMALVTTYGTGDKDWNTFTNEAANILRVGAKDVGGVVLFVDWQSGKVKLEVSRALEGAITDIDSHKALTEFAAGVPKKRAGSASEDATAFPRALTNLLNYLDPLVRAERRSALPPVTEKDASFTYFFLGCGVIILLSSIIAVLLYSETWYYTFGSLLGSAASAVLYWKFGEVVPLSIWVVVAGVFISSFISAFLFHRAGDGLGWDIADVLTSSGGGSVAEGMAQGVADFAGGGAGTVVDGITQAASGVAEAAGSAASGCNIADCNGCDIGDCDFT